VGRIPASLALGWFALLNPALKLAYLSFFTGPAAAADDDIILRFNNLWMQYGGRNFSPWAAYEGGTDLSYCLGMENSIAALASGLDYALEVKQVLDTPVTFTVPAGGAKTLRYGVLFASSGDFAEGIVSTEAGEKALICRGKTGAYRSFPADPSFALLKALEKAV
jgi:hypothetical protein